MPPAPVQSMDMVELPDKFLSPSNPRVFLDFEADGRPLGRVVMELFANYMPKTVENFRALCLGSARNKFDQKLAYSNSAIHSIIPGWAVIGGDITHHNGTGGESIYGRFFDDEGWEVSHDRPGRLSMMSFKNNTNNSQFFIPLIAAPWLDDQYVSFGQVITGFEVLERIEKFGSVDGRTKADVRIAAAGDT